MAPDNARLWKVSMIIFSVVWALWAADICSRSAELHKQAQTSTRRMKTGEQPLIRLSAQQVQPAASLHTYIYMHNNRTLPYSAQVHTAITEPVMGRPN